MRYSILTHRKPPKSIEIQAFFCLFSLPSGHWTWKPSSAQAKQRVQHSAARFQAIWRGILARRRTRDVLASTTRFQAGERGQFLSLKSPIAYSKCLEQ